MENAIKNTEQPINSSLMLTNDLISGGDFTGIDILQKYDKSKSKYDERYIIEINDYYHVVITSEKTRMLITNAIIPLGFKWSVNTTSKSIIVKWDHWIK